MLQIKNVMNSRKNSYFLNKIYVRPWVEVIIIVYWEIRSGCAFSLRRDPIAATALSPAVGSVAEP